MKMQDVKMTDEFARHESETQEIAGHAKEGQCWMHSVYSLLYTQSYCVGSRDVVSVSTSRSRDVPYVSSRLV